MSDSNAASTKASIRERLLGRGPQIRSVKFDLFGTPLEVRAPRVQDARAISNLENMDQIVHALIHWTYIPGTNEHPFEPTDSAAIKEWPIGQWLQDLGSAIEELVGVDVKSAEKNSEAKAGG